MDASADAAPGRSRYDLTKSDWAELAKTGTVRYCLPRNQNLEQLGLAPKDAEILESAYGRSHERVRLALLPYCADLSDAGAVLDETMTLCEMTIMTAARRAGQDSNNDAAREVAEIRAGLRPMPAATVLPSPIVGLLLTITGESAALVDELAAQYGRDEARRIVYRDRGCGLSGSFGPSGN